MIYDFMSFFSMRFSDPALNCSDRSEHNYQLWPRFMFAFFTTYWDKLWK